MICVLLACPHPGSGQVPEAASEAGLPYFIEHFSPHANPQNWGIVQDSSGVIYVANNDGILVYDGISWRLIRIEGKGIVRSLALGPDDTIYAGLGGDMGMLKRDSTGTLAYRSLVDEIPPGDRTIDDVWTTAVTSQGVYFQTSRRLFRWNGSNMRMWDRSEKYHTAFTVRDRFYVRIRGKGLHHMVEDSLHLVPGGEQMTDLHVFMMSPHGHRGILIGTRQGGLFTYRGTQIEPIESDITPVLRRMRAYHGTHLWNGSYAVATLGGGVLIIDAEGNVLDMLSTNYELPDGVVNFLYPDRQGGLWLALHNRGVVRVDVPTPLTAYGDGLGPQGIIYSMRRHNGTLYTATGRGLYYLDREGIMQDGERGQSRFRQIPGLTPSSSLLSVGDVLLVASQEGIYALSEPGSEPQRICNQRAFALREDTRTESRVLAGTRDGLLSLQQSGDGWEITQVVESVDKEIRSIVQSAEDTLWLAAKFGSDSEQGNVLRVTFGPDESGRAYVDRFGQSDGLPGDDVRIGSVDGTPVFAASKGVYRFDPSTERFRRASAFPPEVDTEALRSFTEDSKGNLWMVFADHVAVAAPNDDGGYHIRRPNALRLSHPPFAQLYVEPTGTVWLSADHQLIRYDPTVDKNYEYRGRALVRKVETVGDGRTILGHIPTAQQEHAAGITLPFEYNSLQFSVAAPFYNAPEATSFQFSMTGIDEGWSEWIAEPTRSYTNLGEGTYEFRVRARNVHGLVSEAATFSFRILPPWYRTWWAYLSYATLMGLLTVGTVRYRRLVRKQKKAEQQAKELARERLINERLQEANERLKEANEWKDTLVANTSHELRTPLAGILGFTNVLKEELSGHHQEFVDLIETNGERLLQTVDRLLDMSKLEAGEMPLDLSTLDLSECVEDVVDSLQPLARDKDVALKVSTPDAPVEIYLDDEKLQEVVYNLVGNAIKFTDDGHVHVRVKETDGVAKVVVEDTGIGVSSDFMDELFDAFTQESKGTNRSYDGTGLGLFITAQLVGLMGGNIDARSTKGEGSVFTVTFKREWHRSDGHS